jgi:hypothetical protein
LREDIFKRTEKGGGMTEKEIFRSREKGRSKEKRAER